MTEIDRRYRELTDRFEKYPEYWVESMRIDFVEALERMMEKRGVSRAELARRMDSSPAYVTQMLKALFNPTLLTLAKVALALDARVELALVPKDAPHGRRAAPLREPRRREVQHEFVAADRPARARSNESLTSDKPAKPRSRKP